MKENTSGKICFQRIMTIDYLEGRLPTNKINLINKSVQKITALFLIKVFRDKTTLRRHHYGTQN